jgi:amino-acid N-acetyltransferase
VVSEPTVEIGLGTPAEMDAVRALLEEAGLPTSGVHALIHTLLVARVGPQVVGCAAIEPCAPCALLRSVAVTKEVRGLGLGLRLTEAALELARTRGMERVYLLTETADEFFSRVGFVVVRREAVDSAVRESEEFARLCPGTAKVMMLELTVHRLR